MRHVGVIRESGSAWRSETDDPQFFLSVPILRPKYCVLFLEALGDVLDPTLYFDRGHGLDESDSMPLQHSEAVIYVVSLKEMRDVVRIRFDPSSKPTRFRFYANFIYRDRALAPLIAEASRKALAAEAKPPIITQIAKSKSSKLRRPVARSTIEHYRHVIALAATESNAKHSTSMGLSEVEQGISLVAPTYNTPPKYLADLVESFLSQASIGAELILADDGSTSPATLKSLGRWAKVTGIRVVPHFRNTGIAAATNRGIRAACGRWVGFIDHDDALSPYALSQFVAAIKQYPEAKFFYTDEVIADKKLRPVGYLTKPAFDPVLLSGVNYINHLSLYRRDRLGAIGGLRDGFEGSQDHDLLLRYLEGLPDTEIVHIPFPAYLWRRGPSTYSTTYQRRSIESARRALSQQYSSTGDIVPVEAALDEALHRPRFDARIKQWPGVTVVIPNRDSFALISRVLHDLRENTDYPSLDIVVVDNGSEDSRVLDLYAELSVKDQGFRAVIQKEAFNFAAQVNRGVRSRGGRDVLLLNNDVEVLSPNWLREMVSCLSYPNAGIVGAKLLYPDRTLQHAGVIVGLGGLAGHWYERKPTDFPGPFARLRVRQSFSAVTGACMLLSRACIERVGEFDEHRFAVAYNDVDYCLRAASHGFRTVWTPFATLVHHESVSRGSDEAPKHRERFAREKAALRERHYTGEFEDPSFSPWYTRDRSDPGLLLLDALPKARSGLLGAVCGRDMSLRG